MSSWNWRDVVYGVPLVLLLTIPFISTQDIVRIKDAKINEDQQFVFHRDPLIDNVVVAITREVVQENGRTCGTQQVKAPFERERSTVIVELPEEIKKCLKEGSVLKNVYRVWPFRPYTREIIIE